MKTWLILVMLGGLFAVFAGGPHGAVAQGASETADACKNRGFVNWLDANNEPFQNQGQCVSSVVHGNVLRPVVPPPSLVVEQVQFGPGGTCQFWVRAYDFPEGITYTFKVYGGIQYLETSFPWGIPSGHVILGLAWPSDGVTYNIYAVAIDAAGNHVATSPTVPVGCATATA